MKKHFKYKSKRINKISIQKLIKEYIISIHDSTIPLVELSSTNVFNFIGTACGNIPIKFIL